MQAELMTAHAFDAGTVVYFFGFLVYGLDRAAFNTHIASLAEPGIDPGPGF
jgi:hypothetical protein